MGNRQAQLAGGPLDRRVGRSALRGEEPCGRRTTYCV